MSLIDVLTKEEPEGMASIEDVAGHQKTRGERLADLQAAFLDREQKRQAEEKTLTEELRRKFSKKQITMEDSVKERVRLKRTRNRCYQA